MSAPPGKSLNLFRNGGLSRLQELHDLRDRVTELEKRVLSPSRQQLPAASDRAEDFAATMRGWVWETDAQDRFVYISDSMFQVTGMSPEDHYGKTREEIGVRDVLPDDQWRRYHQKIQRRQPFNDFIYPRKVPKGDKWMRTSGKPVFDLHGEFVGYRGTATDVTTEIEATGKISILNGAVTEKENFLATALRTIPDGVSILDQDQKLTAWNDQLFKVLDLNRDEILAAQNPAKAIQSTVQIRQESPQPLLKLIGLDSRDPKRFELCLEGGKWIECRWSPIPGGGTMAIYRDISETKEMMELLKRQALLDPLTGISNRRSFDTMAQEEFSRSSRYDRPLSFILLDIDHFKSINDTHGHAAGDIALKQVASICADLLRDCDKLARYGGEEFVAMLPETDAEGANIVANRLRKGIERARFIIEGGELSLTASTGAAQASALHSSYDDVLAQADQALYQAKDAGRNCSILL